MSEEFIKEEEKKMTTDGHSRASKRSHSRGYEKKEPKENGKRMSQEEIDKEVAKLKEQLDALRRILEEN